MFGKYCRLFYHFAIALRYVAVALRPPDWSTRRKWIQGQCQEASLLLLSVWCTGVYSLPSPAMESETETYGVSRGAFRTKAVAEYTNSITASRDTNVSPKEAYDTILKYIPSNKKIGNPKAKALDVGAGAGLSTSYLYDQLGYSFVDAVDWSRDAWVNNVLEIPSSVRFFELDDDSFFQMLSQQSKENPDNNVINNKYQVICYNFAVNPGKAVRVAREFLTEDGVLFAPINDWPEYWYKQTYFLLNCRGEVLQKSGAEVGAWSVLFQPDVTSNTCTGIWCGNVNGFQEKRAQRRWNSE